MAGGVARGRRAVATAGRGAARGLLASQQWRLGDRSDREGAQAACFLRHRANPTTLLAADLFADTQPRESR